MQNIMRIARALSRRRKDSVALETRDNCRGDEESAVPLVFFAVGPGGTGKTLLATQLAASLPGYGCPA